MATGVSMKKAMVTGGSRGIGAAIVRKLAADGWQVYIHCNRNGEAAQALAAEVGGTVVQGNLAMPMDVKTIFRQIGSVDLLVNNAGVAHYGLLQDMGEMEWRNLFAVNTDGVYRWFSSRSMPNGTRSYSWVHVTGDTTRKRAFLTEGPLKGDVASYLSQDELFICIGGVNALGGLTDTIRAIGVREIIETMDMDQMTNPNVRNAVLTMRKEVRKIPGIRYLKYTWNPAYKGVDEYLLSRVAATI